LTGAAPTDRTSRCRCSRGSSRTLHRAATIHHHGVAFRPKEVRRPCSSAF
jgi:hypothetical protein